MIEDLSDMHAIVFDDYGDASVLHAADIPMPKRLPGQILIEVFATSVNPIDYRLRSGEMKGLLPGGFPRVPGYDVAGIVADCAEDAPFSAGDRVMAFLNSARGGACADYAVCAVDAAAKIPADMPFEDAAAIPLAGTTALQSLRDHGRMEAGDRVLVNGASGGVGMFAVQIAKAHGCHCDAVASGDNREFCISLGADHFYDYEQVDFTDSSERWDVIFDAAGKSGYWDARNVMNEGGRYVSTEPDVKGMLMTAITWPLSKSGTIMLAHPRSDDLRELIRLYQAGQLKVTIDRRYPMAQCADAHRRIESGVDRGKVVLTRAERS
ncbi:NAD(P)-dependent alcohol dehydrogenase [Aporhodopirellula aestuarii]|uniref:NAD(P)-dependent alcohol dehydrogenase n=1 Tax=Aporhodopirellula aestuarii TaxID=2950107 RepID=A0ABT0TXX5_9BACT|nr:NAD(P)-dependent alcohol dehydrogenase [Aporhodopirellula aestuarii]MCM2369425.1 NAD(P)-dependent alcohol dehydrogenase [Aporhodopirellula aestuarii]